MDSAELQLLIHGRSIDLQRFHNDTEQLLEMIRLPAASPVDGPKWYSTKADIQPLLTQLETALYKLMRNPEAAVALKMRLSLMGLNSTAPEDMQAALQQAYSQPAQALHREEVFNQARAVFDKYGLPVATGTRSLFVRYLELIVEAAELKYDGRQLARDFMPPPGG